MLMVLVVILNSRSLSVPMVDVCRKRRKINNVSVGIIKIFVFLIDKDS